MEQTEKKIIAARITEMPKKMLDPMPAVMVKLDGEPEEKTLFHFFPDEISFRAEEFIGLTENKALRLRYERDEAYHFKRWNLHTQER